MTALAELRIELPPPEVLRRAYVSVLSRRILAGALDVPRALDLIHRHAVQPLGHAADVKAWCFLWEGLDPTSYESLDGAAIEREARALARGWADRPRTLG